MAQSFYPDANSIIDAALGCIRAVDPEDTPAPTSIQITNALKCLNFIVTSWQALGLQVHSIKNASLTLVAGQSSYTVGPGGNLNIARPLMVTQAWLHNTAADTDPIKMQIYGREEYNELTDKESESTPIGVWYNPEYDLPAANSGASAKGKLYVYPTADSTVASAYTMTVVYQRPIQDFAADTDSLDFPQWWYNAIKWQLAADMSYDYGIPVQYLDRIEKRAERELKMVMGWDVEEGSVFLRPAAGNEG